ncbi:hypothetical protein [Streptomyces qinzhouensis]|uniref:hypothetical protein n=1 Tax=Streptomyces qinzhouensis TaxID=2599401 RepID=UPI001FE48B28|nr:hypothetical protein [Streptomyces qinzhouensis]
MFLDPRFLRGVLLRLGNRFIALDSRAGALPTLYTAVQDLPGAKLCRPGLQFRDARRTDPVTAKGLWTVSDELTGTVFPESALPVRG